MEFDRARFRLNSPLGKRILATARDGDYAHPGEEEAIRMTLALFSSGGGARWLDAGCGRGGTADFVRRAGWAQVAAFDLDAVSIQEARRNCPTIAFHACSGFSRRAEATIRSGALGGAIFGAEAA